jgi:nucleotide-binding universal stress UspA family protein
MPNASSQAHDARMSRHILLLTDFSADSERAFAPVIEMADLLGARVTLLHVVETAAVRPVGAAIAAAMPVVMQSEREADAQRRLKDLASRFPRDCDVATVLLRGPDAASESVAWASQHGVDLIAMASHGRSGLRRLVMGSVAESVLRRARLPVLVYPQPRASEVAAHQGA